MEHFSFGTGLGSDAGWGVVSYSLHLLSDGHGSRGKPGESRVVFVCLSLSYLFLPILPGDSHSSIR